MSLAQDIVTALWKEGYLKGAEDKWHRESLDEYQAELIDTVQEIIHASQRPNKTGSTDRELTLLELGAIARGKKLQRSFKLTEPYDGATGHHDGGDRVGDDPSPVPCS